MSDRGIAVILDTTPVVLPTAVSYTNTAAGHARRYPPATMLVATRAPGASEVVPGQGASVPTVGQLWPR